MSLYVLERLCTHLKWKLRNDFDPIDFVNFNHVDHVVRRAF